MKNGLNQIMGLRLHMDLELVEKIDVILKQDETEKEYTYPSENAKKIAQDAIGIYMNDSETWEFFPGKPVEIDTKITLKDSPQNPQTEIAKVKFARTLFKKEGD